MNPWKIVWFPEEISGGILGDIFEGNLERVYEGNFGRFSKKSPEEFYAETFVEISQ